MQLWLDRCLRHCGGEPDHDSMRLLGINCNIYSGRPRVLFCLLRKLRNSYIAIASSFLLELYKKVALFYFLSGPPRGGGEGNWGILPWAPKGRYTLIEQSSTLLKQSLHIFCPGSLKLSRRP